jgi:hypothetical protein
MLDWSEVRSANYDVLWDLLYPVFLKIEHLAGNHKFEEIDRILAEVKNNPPALCATEAYLRGTFCFREKLENWEALRDLLFRDYDRLWEKFNEI